MLTIYFVSIQPAASPHRGRDIYKGCVYGAMHAQSNTERPSAHTHTHTGSQEGTCTTVLHVCMHMQTSCWLCTATTVYVYVHVHVCVPHSYVCMYSTCTLYTQRYADVEKFLFSDDNITIDPVVHLLSTYTCTCTCIYCACSAIITVFCSYNVGG